MYNILEAKNRIEFELLSSRASGSKMKKKILKACHFLTSPSCASRCLNRRSTSLRDVVQFGLREAKSVFKDKGCELHNLELVIW